METIKPDDDSGHWKESLLGDTFWREQERLNRPNEEFVEATRCLTLHKRFPFNLSEGSAPRQQNPPNPKTRRRFSTSDAWSLRVSSPPATNLPLDNPKRSLHQFHLRSPTEFLRRAGFFLRSSFKKPKEKNTIKPVLPAPIQKDLGTPARPLVFFGGDTEWDRVSNKIESLCIGFPSVNQSESGTKSREKQKGKDTLDIEHMASLCEFRNLRILKITSMRQSYQKYIWRAAWLNLNLEELELGMELAPRIRAVSAENGADWPFIRGEWTFEVSGYSDPVYYGELGDGNLHRKVGTGEYLDKYAIEKARLLAGVTGRTLNRLSIKKLTLSGFVVDADPFIQWFEPSCLRTIHFKEDCVDAGFYLTSAWKAVAVLFPTDEKSIPVRSVDLSNNLKVIELREGRKIGEVVCCLV